MADVTDVRTQQLGTSRPIVQRPARGKTSHAYGRQWLESDRIGDHLSNMDQNLGFQIGEA